MTSRAKAEKGWRVSVAYVGADRELKWGDFRHSQKARALAVYRNLRGSAVRTRVFKDGKLQFETGPELVATGDLEAMMEFLKDDPNADQRSGVGS